MNIRSRNGKVLSVRLLKQEQTILQSAQGICAVVAKTLAGETAAEKAEAARGGLAAMLSILTAEVPAKLEPKK